MPELPDVTVHVERLEAFIAAKIFEEVRLRSPFVLRTVEFHSLRFPRCRYEFFVAFSCRRRCLCPSCHQKRALLIAEYIAREVCEPVWHRQFVFMVPKCLRLFFRFDRGWRVIGSAAHTESSSATARSATL